MEQNSTKQKGKVVNGRKNKRTEWFYNRIKATTCSVKNVKKYTEI